MSCPSRCARRRGAARSLARPGNGSTMKTSMGTAVSARRWPKRWVSGGVTDTTAQGDPSPQDALQDGGPRENTPRDGSAPAEATPGSEPPQDEPEHDGALGHGPEYVFDSGRIVARRQGRDEWPRDARRQLEEHRWQHPAAVPRSRGGRLLLAAERLEEELDAERRGNEAYEHYKAHGRKSDGRRFGRAPNPWVAPDLPEGKVNITDPDSHYMKTREGFVQGYNAQAVVTEQQIVLAAEITTSTVDWSQLEPMVSAAVAELEHAGVSDRPRIALADSQYWNEEHIDEVVANQHVQVLIPPESRLRDEPRPGWTGGRYDWMRAVLKSEVGSSCSDNRPAMIEPVFGQTKHNRSITRFLRRGRSAVRTEWRLLMATHNLAKLHRHHLATVRAREGKRAAHVLCRPHHGRSRYGDRRQSKRQTARPTAARSGSVATRIVARSAPRRAQPISVCRCR